MLVETVPEGLTAMPPGPALGAVLAGIDLSSVPNDDVVDVLVAQSRQAAHEQARLLAALVEVGRCAPSRPGRVERLPRPDPFACDEIRAALSWTRRAADREWSFAEALMHDMPRVFAALSAGDIDRPKAWVLHEHLFGLTPQQIEVICAALMPLCGALTTGEIGARLRRMVLAVDPAHYERRYRKGLRERRVICYLAADGTAVISASGLSVEEATAARDRIDRLAVVVKNAGHPGTRNQVRADIVMGLLDGSLHGLGQEEIVAALWARYNACADGPDAGGFGSAAGKASTSGPPRDGDGPDPAAAPGNRPTRPGHRPSGHRERGGSSAGRSGIERSGIERSGIERSGIERSGIERSGIERSGTEGVSSGARSSGTGGGTARDGGAGGAVGGDSSHAAGTRPGSRSAGEVPSPIRGVVVHAELSTLLGRDEHAGEVRGLGVVPASVARQVVERQRRAQWRFAVLDDGGRLVIDGLIRHRPAHLPHDGVAGGIVELQVPAALLAELSPDTPAAAVACGEWRSVVADIAAQYAARDGRDLDTHPEERFPRAALRRHVEARDRTCVFMGCSAPAGSTDQDHTVDVGRGGATVAADLGLVCRHDHRLKHEAGWTLQQPEPGTFVWTSPLGRVYRVQPEPIVPPVPDPVPAEPDPWHDEPAHDTDDPLTLRRAGRAPPTEPAPDTPAAHPMELDGLGDEPPF